MTQADIDYIETSKVSGAAYGYPQCCIDEFIIATPSALKRGQTKAFRRAANLRFKAAHFKGQFSGFIPCYACACKILAGKTTLDKLILPTRSVTLPFPFDWSMK